MPRTNPGLGIIPLPLIVIGGGAILGFVGSQIWKGYQREQAAGQAQQAQQIALQRVATLAQTDPAAALELARTLGLAPLYEGQEVPWLLLGGLGLGAVVLYRLMK